MLLLSVVVIVAIYFANRALSFAAGVGYAVLSVLLAMAGGFLWLWPFLCAIYAFGYVWGWLPSALYSFGSSAGGTSSVSDDWKSVTVTDDE